MLFLWINSQIELPPKPACMMLAQQTLFVKSSMKVRTRAGGSHVGHISFSAGWTATMRKEAAL